MSWGRGWGINWGGGTRVGSGAPVFSVAGASAYTNRSVLVTFTDTPFFGSVIDAKSASNPRNWTITDIDTGAALTVVSVVQVTGQPQVIVSTLQAFTAPLDTYQVSVAGSVIATDTTVLTSPTNAEFFGAVWIQQGIPTQQLVDVFNPQGQENLSGGSLQIGSDGDYVNESGLTLIRKLITRRIITAVGAFRHLPGYGAGLPQNATLTPSDLVSLRAQIQSQVLLEPEVDAASVALTGNALNMLTIQVAAKLRSSNTIVPVTFTPRGVGIQF